MISFLGNRETLPWASWGNPKNKIGNPHNSYVYHDIFVVKESRSKRKMTTPLPKRPSSAKFCLDFVELISGSLLVEVGMSFIRSQQD